jgi:hypothetical protein
MSYRVFYSYIGTHPMVVALSTGEAAIDLAAEIMVEGGRVYSAEHPSGEPIPREMLTNRAAALMREQEDEESWPADATHEIVILGPDGNWFLSGSFNSLEQAQEQAKNVMSDINDEDRVRIREVGQP